MKAYKGTASVPFSVDDVIRYPVAVQQKYDGIRCIVNDGIAQSASGKPLPCALLNYLVYALPYGYDGEIIHEDGYRFADSWCMSRDSTHDPKIHYVIYDRCVDRLPFSHRRPLFFTEQSDFIQTAPAFLCSSPNELARTVEAMLKDGKAEGVIVRQPHTFYKHGRSSKTIQECCAIKPFVDFEARIYGAISLRRNHNEPEVNELGLTKRSSHAAGKEEVEQLGAFLCTRLSDNVDFKVGTGFTTAQRVDFWHRRYELYGKLITVKSLAFGEKDAPRSPVFKGFRNPLDLTAE